MKRYILVLWFFIAGFKMVIAKEYHHHSNNNSYKWELNLNYLSEVITLNNQDLRKYDTETPETTVKTDDLMSVFIQKISVSANYSSYAGVSLYTQILYLDLWGSRLEHNYTAENADTRIQNNPVYFPVLFLQYQFKILGIASNIRIGRQRFSISNTQYEYIFNDHIDGITLHSGSKKLGYFTLLIFDVLHGAGNIQNLDEYNQYIGYQQQPTNGFQGDVNSYRFGGKYNFPGILTGLRIFLFGTYMGAGVDSGHDLYEENNLYNNADHDYYINSGLQYKSLQNMNNRKFSYTLQAAYTYGKNYITNNREIKIQGLFTSATFQYSVPMFTLLAHLVYAEGAQYDNKGTLKNYGFVTMKGNKIGGFLLNQIYGYYPAPYPGVQGIYYEPYMKNRSAGTMAANIFVTANFTKNFKAGLSYWFLTDTSHTALDRPQNIEYLPYKVQAKFGQIIGHEINLHLSLEFQQIKFRFTGAVFVPGPYFSLPNITPDSPQGNDPFWGLKISAEVKINFNK